MTDLTPVVQIALSLVSAAAIAVVPFVVPALRKYLHLRITAQQEQRLNALLQDGAGAAYGFVAARAGSIEHVEIRNAAIAAGVAHVITAAPELLAALGVGAEEVRGAVTAKLGGLMAVDPTITIAGPTPPVPATTVQPLEAAHA